MSQFPTTLHRVCRGNKGKFPQPSCHWLPKGDHPSLLGVRAPGLLPPEEAIPRNSFFTLQVRAPRDSDNPCDISIPSLHQTLSLGVHSRAKSSQGLTRWILQSGQTFFFPYRFKQNKTPPSNNFLSPAVHSQTSPSISSWRQQELHNPTVFPVTLRDRGSYRRLRNLRESRTPHGTP